MIVKIKDIFLVSAPDPIRLVVCVDPSVSAAECAAQFYDPEKEHIMIEPEEQDIDFVASKGKTLVMLDGEKAKLNGHPCNAVTLLYDHNS